MTTALRIRTTPNLVRVSFIVRIHGMRCLRTDLDVYNRQLVSSAEESQTVPLVSGHVILAVILSAL
jgi:hypothetical protein